MTRPLQTIDSGWSYNVRGVPCFSISRTSPARVSQNSSVAQPILEAIKTRGGNINYCFMVASKVIRIYSYTESCCGSYRGGLTVGTGSGMIFGRIASSSTDSQDHEERTTTPCSYLIST